ncbi:unnamed protein product [Paramecium sonneborni]|uniref:Uncharacterized protein n=1 Tax=Paramecium sonneborni TaxID=65129 RepID=A0A8S1QEC0_9CILI|nr:unnamed protein product [Paramecium sonneborni]
MRFKQIQEKCDFKENRQQITFESKLTGQIIKVYLDTIKQVLTDLKTNICTARELHKKNEQSLGFSESEQRSECVKKDKDVQSKKKRDTLIYLYIKQIKQLQSLSKQLMIQCIKSQQIASALVKFLREQLDKHHSNATPAQKQEFLQKYITLCKYIEQGINLNESRWFLFGDGYNKADSAVVLISSQSNDSIKTVIVVQMMMVNSLMEIHEIKEDHENLNQSHNLNLNLNLNQNQNQNQNHNLNLNLNHNHKHKKKTIQKKKQKMKKQIKNIQINLQQRKNLKEKQNR